MIQRLNKRKLPVLFQIPNSELNPQLDAILMKPTVEFGDASRCSKVQKVTKPSDNNYIQCLERLTNGIKPQMQAALGLEASLSPPTKKKTSISTLKSPLSELQRTLDGVKSRIRSYTMSTSVPGSSETETGIAASVSKPASPLEDDSDSGRRPRLTKKTGFRMKAGDQSSLALSEALGKGERVRRALKHVALI